MPLVESQSLGHNIRMDISSNKEGPLPAFSQWLVDQLAKTGYSLGFVEQRTAIRSSVLSRIVRGYTRRPEEETIRRLAQLFKANPELLLALAGHKRYITRQPEAPTMALPPTMNVILIPVYSQQAGQGGPKEVVQEAEMPLATTIRTVAGLFGLRASGDSMEPTIHDGETLVIDRTRSWRAGVVVLAETAEGLLVKRAYPHPSGVGIVLRSDNPAYPQTTLVPESAIQGVVVAAARDMG